eukprot:jgi/Bigna1/67712/fgenesh1_pg.4_\
MASPRSIRRIAATALVVATLFHIAGEGTRRWAMRTMLSSPFKTATPPSRLHSCLPNIKTARFSPTRRAVRENLLWSRKNIFKKARTFEDGRIRVRNRLSCFAGGGIIGDVHGMWDDGDKEVLRALKPDLVLFVGDFGNENQKIVQSIASFCDFPKAVILGNHDAWRSIRLKKPTDALKNQIEMLRKTECDAGYNALKFTDVGVGVVGCRALSFGGGKNKRSSTYRLLSPLYGIKNHAESVDRIVANIKNVDEASQPLSCICLAHNGPTGLGEKPYSICGKDFPPAGGDWGDPDLEEALMRVRVEASPPSSSSSSSSSCPAPKVSMVAFGHMHANLLNGGRRQMVVEDEHGTVFVNAAEVPRWEHELARPARSSYVTMVDIDSSTKRVIRVEGLWVTTEGVTTKNVLLYSTPPPTSSVSAVTP